MKKRKREKSWCVFAIMCTVNAMAETGKIQDIGWSVFTILFIMVLFVGMLIAFSCGPAIKRKKLEKKAKEGNAKALYELGCDLCTTESEDQQRVEGIIYLLKAAEQNFSPGLQKAKIFIKLIKEKKLLLDFCKEKGNGFYQRKEYDKAVVYYRLASEVGDASATYNLGVCYFNGFAVEKNIDVAMEMFLEAAKHKHPLAQYQLGRAYETGNGVQKDLMKAMDCYRKAFYNGIDEAKQRLIHCAQTCGDYLFQEGKIDQAVFMYDKAADVGDKYCTNRAIECSTKAGDIYFSAFEESKEPEDIKKAVEYYGIAAKYGDLHAQFYLGLSCLENNETVLAFKWIEIAAQRENGEAQYYCGMCYENGIGTDKNYIRALYWYKKALQNGIVEAKERVERFEKYSESTNTNNAKVDEQELDPYLILEVDRRASIEEIKQAYLQKVKDLHPDFLKSKGLSEEIIKLATAELARINLAWEMIKKERGL